MATKASGKTKKGKVKAFLKGPSQEERLAHRRERPPLNNALIVEPPEGWYLTHLDEPAAGLYGRRWRYGNVWVYLLLKKKTVIPPKAKGGAPTTIESLIPIVIPEKLGQLPDKLYRALFWREGEILFSLRNTLLDKLNTFSTYFLIAILLFFIYLIYSSM